MDYTYFSGSAQDSPGPMTVMTIIFSTDVLSTKT